MEIHAKLHTSEMTWLHCDHVLCALVTSLGARQLSVWNKRRAVCCFFRRIPVEMAYYAKFFTLHRPSLHKVPWWLAVLK